MYRSRLTSLKLFSGGARCLSLSLGLSICISTAWPNQSCKRFIPPLAAEFGIPLRILGAIAEVESKFEPYALNHAGKTLRFSVSQEALRYVETQIQRGETNLDIGCMQINWRVHQKNFKSPQALLNPEHNIRYAAQLLKSLYQERGTWAKAVAAYHSRRPERSDPYLIKIAKSLTRYAFNFRKN